MYQPREILAYGTLSIFLIFITFYGFADSLSKLYPVGPRNTWGSLGSLKIQEANSMSLPDFAQYKVLNTLSSKEFPINDPTKRIIIVGDIHGMMKPFETLLKLVKYDPSQDFLFHVGDITSKGPHKGSLAVLQYMSSNNVTGVRGNHDQLVVEWRSWRNWIYTRPCGKEWLDRLEWRWEQARVNDSALSLESWLKTEKQVGLRGDKTWWKSIPRGGIILDDHYTISKDMSESHFRYLLNLPLRIYIPSAHTFIVHAGLLPSDPRYPVDDKKRQPLARIPTLTRHHASDSQAEGLKEDGLQNITITSSSNASENTITALRNLQEIGILTQIPQNQDPWVTLNIRSVTNSGAISKDSKQGTAWSKIWKQHMQSCTGYKPRNKFDLRQDSVETNDGHAVSDPEDDENMKNLNLKCYPSTTIYGHAAARGLDIKRWSFGLDSGCVYERKLSALVIKGQVTKRKRQQIMDSDPATDSNHDEELWAGSGQNDEEDHGIDDMSKKKNIRNRWLPFGDSHKAKIITTKC